MVARTRRSKAVLHKPAAKVAVAAQILQAHAAKKKHHQDAGSTARLNKRMFRSRVEQNYGPVGWCSHVKIPNADGRDCMWSPAHGNHMFGTYVPLGTSAWAKNGFNNWTRQSAFHSAMLDQLNEPLPGPMLAAGVTLASAALGKQTRKSRKRGRRLK